MSGFHEECEVTPSYYVPHLRAAEQQYLKLKECRAKQKNFVKERVLLVKQIDEVRIIRSLRSSNMVSLFDASHQSAPALIDWIEVGYESRLREQRKMRVERYNLYVYKCASIDRSRNDVPYSILDKLRDLGYTIDDFSRRYDKKEWDWSNLMNRSQPLTDNGKAQLTVRKPQHDREVLAYFSVEQYQTKTRGNDPLEKRRACSQRKNRAYS